MAVFAKDRGPSRAERAEWSSGFRRAWTIYAVEVPLVSLYLCMLGAIASLSTARPDEGDAPKTFIEQLVLQNNLVASTIVSLLLVALAMMALSTMTALFSASLYTLCYDISPKLFRGPIVAEGHAINELGPLRRIAIAGGVLYLDSCYRLLCCKRGFSDGFRKYPISCPVVCVELCPACASAACVGAAGGSGKCKRRHRADHMGSHRCLRGRGHRDRLRRTVFWKRG